MAVNRAKTRQRISLRSGRTQGAMPYVFISPFYIIFITFFLFPAVSALVLGFFRWNGIDTPQYVGIKNFGRLIGDRVFIQAVSNTTTYALASLFVILPLALILAVLLNTKSLRFKPVWRAMYFSPVVTSSVAISFVFSLLYNSKNGLLNVPFIELGLDPINWLGDRDVVRLALILLIGWRTLGLLSIYFLAGLQSIDETLYEAAAMDGANPLQSFFYITVPMLRPIILFVSILVTISSLQIFDEPQILTEGGPSNASMSVVQYLYMRGFTRLRLGYASAVGTLLFGAIFVLSLVQLTWSGMFRGDDHS